MRHRLTQDMFQYLVSNTKRGHNDDNGMVHPYLVVLELSCLSSIAVQAGLQVRSNLVIYMSRSSHTNEI